MVMLEAVIGFAELGLGVCVVVLVWNIGRAAVLWMWER